MIKIATVVGARPQFVKAAVLSRALESFPEFEQKLVHTGQHYDASMSEIFFRDLGMARPDYDLGINREALGVQECHETGPAWRVGRMMQQLEAVFMREEPEWVLVYGDTDSTLAGAMTAAKLRIPLIHVEAGLRSFNMQMPEETNRILTDRLSRLLFCPSDQAVENLEKEGFGRFPVRVFRCGDLMQDAARIYASEAKPVDEVNDLNSFILCTLHRKENIENPTVLAQLMAALETVSARMPVVMPLHPGTRARLAVSGYDFKASPVRFINPVGYLQMVYLLQHCRLVATDSGGLQKEAYFFRKPCLTLRQETEWVELVERGYNILAGHDPRSIALQAEMLWKKDPAAFEPGLYGNGQAGMEIARAILECSGTKPAA